MIPIAIVALAATFATSASSSTDSHKRLLSKDASKRPSAFDTTTKINLADAKVGITKIELREQIRYSNNVIEFFTVGNGYWEATLLSCHPVTGEFWGPCAKARKLILAHTWLKRIASKRLKTMIATERKAAQEAAKKAQEEAAQARLEESRRNVPEWLWNAFQCIHRYEGSWDAATGNGYYGGLQMDYGFMSTYGGEYLASMGPASNWPEAVQIEVAARAYNSGRGFGPWPNTRHSCGV